MLNRRHIRGLSLVEMMVGIAIALVLVAGAMTFYTGTLRGSGTSNMLVQLNQNMRSIMSVIDYDLRRAGFSRAINAGTATNDFAVRSGGTGTVSDIHVSTADQSCILYSYDFDQDGKFTPSEIFGFRRNAGTGQVETLDPAAATKPASTDTGADCETLGLKWLPMNVPSTVDVRSLTFSTTGSKCIAFDPLNYDPLKTATFVTWSPSGPSIAACDTTLSGGNRVPVGQTSPVIPPTFTAMAETRFIDVTLVARHATDTSLERTLKQSVRVRNDRAITLP